MTGVTHSTLVLSASATKTRLTWAIRWLPHNGRTTAPRKPEVYWGIQDVCLRPRSKIWTYWALFTDVNTAVWTLSKTLDAIMCSVYDTW